MDIIPEDFSAKTMSFISDNPQQAQVLVEYNDYGGTNGKVVTSALIPQLQAQVASTITENYARGTLEGLILWATASRSQATPVVETLRSVGLTEQADALAAQLNRLDPANPENMVSQLGRLRDGTAQLRYNLTSPDAPY